MNERLANAIIIVITTVWAVNFFAGVVVETYEPSEAINAIFMGTVGLLFAIKGRGGGGSNGRKNGRD